MKGGKKNIREMCQILVTCDGFEYKEVKNNMKVFKLKKWLCGIVTMLSLVFITSQATFATDENTTGGQNITSPNHGEVGIARYRIPSKKKKGLRELDKAANIHTPGGPVQVYSAFASDVAADPEVGDVPVVPVVGDASAYLYVAFRVTGSSKVDIKWFLDDSSTAAYTVTAFEDPVTGGNLSPNYWYFAWFKPDSVTPNGLHSAKISVRKYTPAGNQSWFDDSCRFYVLAYLD